MSNHITKQCVLFKGLTKKALVARFDQDLASSDGGAVSGDDVELIVLEGESGRTLAFAPGHLSVSALPGEPGNSIIAGHRDTHFQFLQFMEKGESIVLEMPDGIHHRYQVTDIDVVDSRRGSILIDTDSPMLSLVTCYPFQAEFAGGPLRYVVTAKMIY